MWTRNPQESWLVLKRPVTPPPRDPGLDQSIALEVEDLAPIGFRDAGVSDSHGWFTNIVILNVLYICWVVPYLSPESEHWLDWFHLTMRLTVMGQMAKGLALERAPAGPTGDDEVDWLDVAGREKPLESLKWHLWHRNVYRALQIVEDLECDLDSGIDPTERETKLLKAVSEFHHYIEVNQAFIPNYGDRYRHGETISSAFVESTVNQVISKRMVKKQQMRWTQRGGALAAAGPHAGPERRPPAHIRALVSGPEDRHRANPGSRRIAPGLARSLKRGPLQRRPQGKRFWSVLVPSRKASKTNPGHRPRSTTRPGSRTEVVL